MIELIVFTMCGVDLFVYTHNAPYVLYACMYTRTVHMYCTCVEFLHLNILYMSSVHTVHVCVHTVHVS